MSDISATSATTEIPLNARAYLRAYSGKLMIIERNPERECSSGDFFHIEDVGTHPTGLLVTGVFENARRGHMMATSVREANAAEIAWQSGERSVAAEPSAQPV